MTELLFITNSISTVREITHDGKPYLVAPVVMIREGVLNGHLLLAEEFGKYVDSWNGRPVSLGHPQRNGEYISANSPDVWALEVPGLLWNTKLDSDRLVAEIWVDLERAEKIGERAMSVVASLRANDSMEVSTGYFADIEEVAGNYKGKRYYGIHRNIRSDHLALLPGEIGACSWEDGCGTPRVNSRKGEGMGIETNEMTLDDRAVVVRRAFWDKVASETPDYFTGDWDVVAVFDATLIAKDWTSKGHVAFPYALAEEGGEVTFGDAAPVDVVYRAKEGGAEVVVANQAQATPVGAHEVGLLARIKQWVTASKVEGIAVQQQEEQNVKKCELVAAITANKQAKLSKEQLEKLDEVTLQGIHDSLVANAEASPTATTVVAPAVELPQAIVDFAKMIEGLGGADKLGAALGSIAANANAEKNDLVADLVANEQCQFDEAELGAMSVNSLRKLAGSLQVRDYSAAGGVIFNRSREVDTVLEMPKPQWVVAKEAK